MSKFTQQQINLLLSIANRQKSSIKMSATSSTLHAKYAIGKAQSRDKIVYSSSDVKIAREWCERLGIDHKTYDPQQTTRSQMGKQQASEKSSGISVYSRFVPVRALGNVKVNDKALCIPDCGFALLTPQEVFAISATAILLVENLETFARQIHMLADILPTNCLVVFRGSPQFGGNNEKIVSAWRNEYDLPVISFFDYDISGLIKQSEGSWDSWVLPKKSALISTKITGNFEDLAKQMNELNAKLPKVPKWLESHLEMFDELKGSITQERLLAFGIDMEIAETCSEVIE
jgi:hypothetical protein